MVHVGQGALPLISCGGEVLLEPLRLGGAGTAADLSLPAVAVEGDYVPAPQVVGVVALIGVSGSITEVVEVASGPFGFVLVVSRDGLGALLELSPARLVALPEVLGRPIWVGVVAQGEDRALDATDEPGGCLVALTGAVGYVARCDDDLPRRRSRGPFRGAAKGEEYRQEGNDDHRRASTDSEASERLPGLHGDKVAQGDSGSL